MATRYLIGQGEKLTEEISRPPRGDPDKSHPYEFDEAVERLAASWARVAKELSQLPPLACPDGEVVIGITLHPSYLAKSYYPSTFFREHGLRHVGSRAVHIVPEHVVNTRAQIAGKAQAAPLLYVAGDLEEIQGFAAGIADWNPRRDAEKNDFRKIETVNLPGPSRLKPIQNRYAAGKPIPLEVVLHTDEGDSNANIAVGFERFARSLGLEVDLDLRRYAGGLCFVPMYAPREVLAPLLQFTFLRALREMPRLVPFDPALRNIGPKVDVSLGGDDAAANDLAVAIFDGGLPPKHGLEKWATPLDAPGVGKPVPAALAHGLAVTSAFLFGPLAEDEPVPTPFSNVDHWRVFGEEDAGDFELYAVLDRIDEVLSSRPYRFVNISLGPACAIDDDDVNRWTSTLDQLFADGETVVTVACGNNGQEEKQNGLHRIQPPSDGVNIIAVGASDKIGAGWKRAKYSACGPGRSPGYVKPDFLTFGGSPSSPFLALTEVAPHRASGKQGTSFASPLAMRSGTSVSAHFAESLWAPTIKAILVHHASDGKQNREEVGWGRVSHHLEDLVLCGDNEAHIVYQRQMPDSGAVRFYLPVPPGLKGNVEIKATFCFYCDVDPEDAINYTRAGLQPVFRPNTKVLAPPYAHKKTGKIITPTLPPTDTFFSAGDLYPTEHMARADAHKWETTLSNTRTKRANSLDAPAFDVSHFTREHGQSGGGKANMKIALVLSIRNRHAPDLYDKVLASAGARLQPMRPRTGVRVLVR